MTHRFFCLFFVGFLALSAGAQTINKQRLDSFFNILEANDRAMGSIALSKNGQIIYERAIGAQRIVNGKSLPAKPETKYRIGSITKMFTATMVFQAIEEKKLGLATPLATYFPQLPNADKITIGLMLSHHSGLHNFTDDSIFVRYYHQPQSRKAMLARFAANKADFTPDSTMDYSNTNFVLLGYILEDLYKKPYSKLLQDNICSKISLKATSVPTKSPSKNEAYSYSWDSSWHEQPFTDASVPAGAGAIISTAADLNKFAFALFTGKFVSLESLHQMMSIRDGQGMGMTSYPLGIQKVYGHTGGIDGFQSMLEFNPADSVTLAYCGNGIRYARNDIVLAALGSYYGFNFPIPTFTNTTYQPESLDAYPGTYTSDKLPIKLTITTDEHVLMAQATGQSAFPLMPVAKDLFSFEKAGVVIEFHPELSQLILKQGGGAFIFTKEK